ncbi:MAG: hypothetical protein ACKPKO_33415, partial [Candidatus Fonsibacter sp.]
SVTWGNPAHRKGLSSALQRYPVGIPWIASVVSSESMPVISSSNRRSALASVGAGDAGVS